MDIIHIIKTTRRVYVTVTPAHTGLIQLFGEINTTCRWLCAGCLTWVLKYPQVYTISNHS